MFMTSAMITTENKIRPFSALFSLCRYENFMIQKQNCSGLEMFRKTLLSHKICYILTDEMDGTLISLQMKIDVQSFTSTPSELPLEGKERSC